MHDAAIYAAARDAVLRFMRDAARMPSLPSSSTPAFARVIATDRAPAQMMPRPDDVSLALRPFHDLSKATPIDQRDAMLRKRLAVVVLLCRLAASTEFEWNATMDCGTERALGEEPTAKELFWFRLLCELDPEAAEDKHHHLQRDLVVLSRTGSLRFMLSIDSDPNEIDFPELLELFLMSDVESDDDYRKVLTACSLPIPSKLHRDVEIGLSFTRGKFSEAKMAQLMAILARVELTKVNSQGIRFRIVSLRFRRECSIPQNALEVLGQAMDQVPSVKSLALANLGGVKPGAQHAFLRSITQTASRSLRRLIVSQSEAFPGIATAFRGGQLQALEELDIAYDITPQNAAWLAFAFFHVDSRSSVSSLRLRAKTDPETSSPERFVFTKEWVEAFERALKTRTPLRDLVNIDGADEADGCCFVQLKLQTPAKSHPFPGAKLQCKISNEADTFERLGCVKNLVAIVVPGIGVGWVPVSAVIGSRIQLSCVDEDLPARVNGRVKSLIIDPAWTIHRIRASVPHHQAALLDFISFVGYYLNKLHLPHTESDSHGFDQILAECQNLKELNLSGNRIIFLFPLMAAYKRGECRIETLGLATSQGRTEQSRLPSQLSKHLAEVIPRMLRALEITLEAPYDCVGERAKIFEESVDELLTSLATLPGMDTVQLAITASNRTHVSSRPQLFSSGFRSEPLPLRCKLAFLSVIRCANGQKCAAINRLDSRMALDILRFSRVAIKCRLLQNALVDLGA